jgi:2-dehydropantoate 2-reductase
MAKILVFGAGSIGLFLGTKLHASGYMVEIYGRRKLESLPEEVLINQTKYPAPPRIHQLYPNDYDIIFITVKLYDIQAALEALKQNQISSQILAFIQNGLLEKSFYEQIQDYPGLATISIFAGYNLVGNQVLVTENGMGWHVEDTELGRRICNLLNSSDISCSVNPHLSQVRAIKMIWNASSNALSALEKKTLGELLEDKRLKEIVHEILREAYEVLKDEYNLPSLESMQERINRYANQMRNHYSSMYQDVISGRRTEVEFFNGLIVKLGREKGIPTPYNQDVYLRLLKESSPKLSTRP